MFKNKCFSMLLLLGFLTVLLVPFSNTVVATVSPQDGLEAQFVGATEDVVESQDLPIYVQIEKDLKKITLINQNYVPADLYILALDAEGFEIARYFLPAFSDPAGLTFKLTDIFGVLIADQITSVKVVSDEPIKVIEMGQDESHCLEPEIRTTQDISLSLQSLSIASAPLLKLPLPANKSWLLTVQAGGKTLWGGTPDYYHTDAKNGYYSLDFDDISKENGGVVDVDILAAAAGTVLAAGGSSINYCNQQTCVCTGTGSWGYTVEIDHGGGFRTRYAHLKSSPLAFVTVGQQISQGQKIGVMGNTGSSCGTHLHFRLSQNLESKSTTTALQGIVVDGRSIENYKVGTTSNPLYYLSTNTIGSTSAPSLLIDGSTSSTKSQGGTFNFTGANYTPNGSVARYLKKPDGTTQTLANVTANSSGNVSWSYASVCADTPGTYSVWAKNNTSGKTSNTVTEIITASSSCTIRPNLTPYKPPTWSDKIVVSKTTGTNTDSSPLYTTDTLYVDWAVANLGKASISTTFYTKLYVDTVLKYSWNHTSAPANYYIAPLDYSIGTLTAGTHYIKIVTDATGVITESNEGDNEYTKTITVTSATNNPPVAEAAVSKSLTGPYYGYTTPLTVTKGQSVSLYFFADKDVNGDGIASIDPDGWTNVDNGVSSGGKAEWNTDLNKGTPTFEKVINKPSSAGAANIGPYTYTFNDAPGTYEYQMLRITDRKGAQSIVSKIKVTVAAAPVTTGSVSGKVHKDSASGPALSGASVTCGGKSTTTASDGAFSLSGITAGSQTLSISKSGYTSYSAQVTITAGQNTNAGDRWLTAQATCPSGNGYYCGSTLITGQNTGYLYTCSNGAYSLKTACSYGCQVNAAQTNDSCKAAPVTTGSVSGKLHQNSANGSALSGATVKCGGKSTTTASNGSFSLSGITAGSQTLSISKSGYTSYSTQVTITAGQNTNAGDRWLTAQATCPSGNGYYCGSSSLGQNTSYLYKCSNGAFTVKTKCSNGCKVNSGGTNDVCKAATTCPSGNGDYCGSSSLGQKTNYLYSCSNGTYKEKKKCAKGCKVNSSGKNDVCK